jgi:hypothetical protein
MKISELLVETKKNKKSAFHKQFAIKVRKPEYNDDEDEEEEVPSDPDLDIVPNLMMQVKKAIDVDGNYSLLFKDGKKQKFSKEDLLNFGYHYMRLKPYDRENMQKLGSESVANFKDIIKLFSKKESMPGKV